MNHDDLLLRSTRRLGELIAQGQEAGWLAKRGKKQKLHDATLSLEDLGIEKTESHRAKKLLKLPEEGIRKIIKTLRAEGKTQQEVAALVGLSRQRVSQIESGEKVNNTSASNCHQDEDGDATNTSASNGCDNEPEIDMRGKKKKPRSIMLRGEARKPIHD